MSLSYSIKEGLAGFRRAKFASVASTSAMAVALILIGLFAIVSNRAQDISTLLRQRVGELEIFLDDMADDQLGRATHGRALATPGIGAAQYVSRAEAVEIFERDFGEDTGSFYDEPFLPPSIRVRVESSYANPDSIESLIAHFKSWNRVDDVIYNRTLLMQVQQNLKLVSTMGMLLGALVILASVFLVANTVRLTIYARRLLIRTMKLVGANDTFIQRPFIVEGIVQGILAAVVALGVLIGVYSLVARYLESIGVQDHTGGQLTLLIGVMLALGATLGWIGSYLAARRFIKNVALH